MSPPLPSQSSAAGVWALTTVISRLMVPGMVTNAMPALLVMLFGVSQLTAIVDLAATATSLQQSPFVVRGGLLAGLVAVGGYGASKAFGPVLYGPRLAFLWAMPLSPSALTLVLTPPLIVASAPTAAVALLLGPSAAIAAWIGTAVIGATFTSRRWSLGFCVALASGLGAGWWGALALFSLVWLAPPCGRALRAGRRLETNRKRTRWWARSPIGALIARDLLAILRTHGSAPFLIAAFLPFVAMWIQTVLHFSWSPSQIATGSRIALGFTGALPAGLLATQAGVLGRAYDAPELPVSDTTRLLALYLTGVIPLGLVWMGQLAGGFGTASGALYAAVHAGTLAAAAAWRITGRDRESAAGFGVFAAVFLTIGSVAFGGLAALAEAALTLGLLGDAQRRLRARRAWSAS